jgi:catechol 2,3-dioxygenase-like lactoylglutathione lyase family enzyme
MPAIPAIGRVIETALYVDDLARAQEFYVGIFGARVMLDTPRLVALDVNGESVLLLFKRGATLQPLDTAGGRVPQHGASGVQHLAFAIAASDVDAWLSRLGDVGVEIESRVRWPRGGESLYVRDPDGHSVELITPGLWEIY